MLNKILKTLANNSNYSKLLEVAFDIKMVKRHNYRRYENQTANKKQQLIYFLIKKANELNPKLKLHENNYKAKLKNHKNKPVVKPVIKETPTPKIKKIISKKEKIPNIIKELVELEKTEKTDKEYAKWFYKQPKRIQQVYKEKGAAYRKRGKLHTEAKKITGNSKNAITKRKIILDQMMELTLKIKQLDSITKHFEKTGKIIL
jgi:hypothetical protein